MSNIVATSFNSAVLFSISKGYYMECRIDKIDVKYEHKELIALFYRMELRSLLQRLMYEHSTTRIGIS